MEVINCCVFSVHQNYVGSDVDKVPFFLSVVLTDANHQCEPQYRAILWRKTVIIFNLFLLHTLYYIHLFWRPESFFSKIETLYFSTVYIFLQKNKTSLISKIKLYFPPMFIADFRVNI